MSEFAEQMISALGKNDTESYALACATLMDWSKAERLKVQNDLLEIVSTGDYLRAELAVNTLRFSVALALEEASRERLALAAENIFTPEVLSNLIRVEGEEMGKSCRRVSQELRLLRSIIFTIAKKENLRADRFIAYVEAQVAGTVLAAKVARWKQ